jgi:hypothetical protein
MSLETKVRPTFTIGDLQIIAIALDREIKSRILSGDTSNNFVVHLMDLKKYCEGFNPSNQTSAATMLQQMLGATVEETSQQTKVASLDSYATAQVSPIESNLTDSQIYDLLKLRKDSERTEAENNWMLNKGTMVMIQRGANTKLNAGDI